MTYEEIVRTRRSVRGFLPRQVPEPIIRECLELAQWTPSNCNVQPWRITVASGESRDRLARSLVDAFYAGDFDSPDHPVEVFHDEYRSWQISCAKELYGDMGVARGDMPVRMAATARNFAFFDACLLYTSPSPRDATLSRMPSSA